MKTGSFAINTEKVLGWVGLFLLLVVSKLTDVADRPQETLADRVSGWIARRGIDLVAAIGWLADRLPEPRRVTSPVPSTGLRRQSGAFRIERPSST
jgi:hypothetical protein